jgi:hypothetical protein
MYTPFPNLMRSPVPRTTTPLPLDKSALRPHALCHSECSKPLQASCRVRSTICSGRHAHSFSHQLHLRLQTTRIAADTTTPQLALADSSYQPSVATRAPPPGSRAPACHASPYHTLQWAYKHSYTNQPHQSIRQYGQWACSSASIGRRSAVARNWMAVIGPARSPRCDSVGSQRLLLTCFSCPPHQPIMP